MNLDSLTDMHYGLIRDRLKHVESLSNGMLVFEDRLTHLRYWGVTENDVLSMVRGFAKGLAEKKIVPGMIWRDLS